MSYYITNVIQYSTHEQLMLLDRFLQMSGGTSFSCRKRKKKRILNCACYKTDRRQRCKHKKQLQVPYLIFTFLNFSIFELFATIRSLQTKFHALNRKVLRWARISYVNKFGFCPKVFNYKDGLDLKFVRIQL